MFSKDERVLCIKSGWGDSVIGGAFQRGSCPNIPYRGHIYTIRDCWQSSCGLWWVYLNEIVNPKNRGGILNTEPYFQAHNFVPIKKTQTDITAFTQILAGAGRPVKVKA